ncbi:hypothetical protein FHT70_004869 [Rhizobium sp. BK049]|nr:hypothetical protein [Rhizobium sp. BK049]
MTGAAMAATEVAGTVEETRSNEIDSMPDRLKAVFCCPNSTPYQASK